MTPKSVEELRREFVDELARGYRANSFGLNKPLDSASEALLAAIDREKAASAELPVTMDDTGANGEFVFRPKLEPRKRTAGCSCCAGKTAEEPPKRCLSCGKEWTHDSVWCPRCHPVHLGCSAPQGHR